jgi:hypothetical protein
MLHSAFAAHSIRTVGPRCSCAANLSRPGWHFDRRVTSAQQEITKDRDLPRIVGYMEFVDLGC